MTHEVLADQHAAPGPLTRGPSAAPRPERRARERTVHGDTVVTDHTWLRERGTAEVLAHLEAENAHTDARTAHLADLRTSLARELPAPAAGTDLSAPVRSGDWWYLDRPRIVPGHGLDASLSRIHDRDVQGRGPGGAPLLDDDRPLPAEQMLLADRSAVLGTALSEDHGLLAWAELSELGCTVTVRDLATGEVIESCVRDAGADLVFSADGRHLLLTQVDPHGRTHQVRRHRIGAPIEQDEVLLDEPDPWADLSLSRSRDGSTLVICSRSPRGAEAWHLDLSDPAAAPRSVTGRRENPELVVEHAGDRFLVLSEDAAGRSVLSELPLDHEAGPRRTLLVAAEGEQFDGIESFDRFAALQVRAEGLPAVRVLPRGDDGALELDAAWPLGPGHVLEAVRLDANPEWDQQVVRYRVDGLLTPSTLMQAEVATRESTTLRRAAVAGVDPVRYVARRLWAPAADGTRIPISLLARRDITPDATAPALLFGHGAFGVSLDPSLALDALPILDRGVVLAIAHVRGGGEMGRSWHRRGRMLSKATSIEDFVACADHLVEEGWAAPDRLAAAGIGAGGLLVAGAANLAPRRFRALVAAEPLVDPLESLLDPGVMLTLQEWAEWGDPAEDEAVYRALRDYSPAENLREDEYPAVLAYTALEGSDVPCAEAAVWIARLRERSTSDPARRPVLLRCLPAIDGDGAERRVEAMAWLLDQLGAAGSPAPR